MKIVVIGGTGMFGSQVVANLTHRGHEAVAAEADVTVRGVSHDRLTGVGVAAAARRA